jgi:hypothetical protein
MASEFWRDSSTLQNGEQDRDLTARMTGSPPLRLRSNGVHARQGQGHASRLREQVARSRFWGGKVEAPPYVDGWTAAAWLLLAATGFSTSSLLSTLWCEKGRMMRLFHRTFTGFFFLDKTGNFYTSLAIDTVHASKRFWEKWYQILWTGAALQYCLDTCGILRWAHDQTIKFSKI